MRSLRLFSLSLLVMAALAAALPTASAGDRPDIASLYQAQAIVTGQGEETRATGFWICL